MSKRIIGLEYGSYTFDPVNQQIVFSDLAELSLNQVLLITNITTNQVIYNFADTNRGGQFSGTNILQLNMDVSEMLPAHELMIFLDYPSKMASKVFNATPSTEVIVGNQVTVFDSVAESYLGGKIDFISVKVSHMGFDIEVVIDDVTSYRVSLKELLLDHKLVDTQTRLRTNSEGTHFIDMPLSPIEFYKNFQVIVHNFYPWFGDGVVNGVVVGGRFILS